MEASGVLKGKTAFVTGAARGIGRAVAVAFARTGMEAIAGLDIDGRASPTQTYALTDDSDLAETARLVEAAGARFMPIRCDIRDYAALQVHADAVNTAFGRIDVLAAVAGIQAFKPLIEMDDADWRDQIDINLTGTANTIRAVAPSWWDAGADASSSRPRRRASTGCGTVRPIRRRNGDCSG